MADKIRRAYSILTVKVADAEQRVISGIATTPSTDSYGDVVQPDGAEYDLPLPLLYMHDSRQPIGEVTRAKVTKDGIEIQAQIAKIDEPGLLKDRIDMAWQSMKAGLVKGLSIGFRSLEESYDKVTGGFNFIRWQWVELSAVTIPANADCSITTIRSLDPAASRARQTRPVVRQLSGASDRPKSNMKKTFTQQIADWEATRASKTARMDELISKDDGTTMTEAETEEHDTLEAEVKAIDAQIVRLRAAEKREKDAAAARPVAGTTGTEASESRTGQVHVSVRSPRLEPGQAFARYAMIMGMSQGQEIVARELAKKHYGDYAPELIKMIDFAAMDPIQRQALLQRAAVGGSATTVSGWASELVPYNIMDDFINYIRPLTILGKLGGPIPGNQGTYPNLRKVPFNTRVSGFSAGTTANWIGEGLPITLSKATSLTTSLLWAKLGALAVLTKEEIRFSNPNAELKVRDDLGGALIQKMDHDLIDPAKNASANVSPASITNQTTPVLTTGTTAAALRTDLATLIATFASQSWTLDDIVLIMSQKQALNISLMVSTLSVPIFPTMTAQGGLLVGIPVIATNQAVQIGSPISDIIVAVKAGEIYLADDGVITMDASDQASVEMVDTSSQSGVTGTGASLVSFWQSGLVGLKVAREITWKLRRANAARYLYNVAYSA